MGFGMRLKSVLMEIDMKVSALSKITGIPASTLYSIINKDIDNVGLERVAKIEKAVKAKPGNLIYKMLHDDQMDIEDYKIEANSYTIGGEDKEFWLINSFNQLNHSGQEKAIEQVELLAKIPEYRKDSE